MQSPVTATKRKAIQREAADFDTVVDWGKVSALSSRHHLTGPDVAALLESFGYIVHRPPAPEEVIAPPKAEAKQVKVPKLIVESILKGSIYKSLGHEDDQDDEAFVICRRSLWLKEREAIQQLLRGAKVGE